MMMTVEEVSGLLWAACVKAGVDPALIFEHYNAADIQAYAEAIGQPGGIPAGDLHLWMFSTARTIADGRCLCESCKIRRAKGLVAENPGLMLCPSCRGAGTSCGHCFGRGAVAL